jgi:competence protein ComEC
MLLGDKSRIPEDLKEKLNIAGVRHITAISGMHVAILTTILMTLLIGLGLWRGQAFYFTIVLITLFIVMTGLQPSAIRAGIMGGLFLLGQKLGRKSFSPRAIVMAAALMLVVNPLLLLNDVGFQLSFLAMLGIIYLLPIFQNWFRRIPNVFQFRSILAITLSAQIFTLPILIYNFGYMSLLSPISNVLIVPFLSYIIGFGFLFALVGLLWQPLGWILSLPCWFLLTYITKVINLLSANWLSKFPWLLELFPFLKPFPCLTFHIPWFLLIISYLILGFIVWRLKQREKLKFLNY